MSQKEYFCMISTSHSGPSHFNLRTSDRTIESTSISNDLMSTSNFASSVDSQEESLRFGLTDTVG